jgi:transcriptional regulator with XRE-family HTH domain
MDTPNFRAILAGKVKRLRKARGLTLAELGHASGLSVSYIAEIEAGKKFPKPDRILELAAALDCQYEELTSTKLDRDEDALQAFLNAPGVRDFPFEMFGVPPGDLTKLLTRSPVETTALLRALTDIARQYDIGPDHFVRAALRSYQELTGNYYESIEELAQTFGRGLAVNGQSWTLDGLRKAVAANCGITIDETNLDDPVLRRFKAIVLESPRRLLINPRLANSHKAFLLAREIGYQLLGLKARSQTTPSGRPQSFEHARNDFQASYFAGALLLPCHALTADLKTWLRLPTWQPEVLLQLLDKYRVSAETLVYRMSQLLPSHFGLHTHFFKFTDAGGAFDLIKQLNLTQIPVPAGIRAHEHYCRRWVSTRLLTEFRHWRERQPKTRIGPLVAAQHSRFVEGDQPYFCMGLAVPTPLTPEVVNSFIVGFHDDAKFAKTVRFAKDRTIPSTIIGTTCERCPLAAEACSDRAAPPILYQQAVAHDNQRRAIAILADGKAARRT